MLGNRLLYSGRKLFLTNENSHLPNHTDKVPYFKENRKGTSLNTSHLLYPSPKSVFFKDILSSHISLLLMNGMPTHETILSFPSPTVFKYHKFHSQIFLFSFPLSIPTILIVTRLWSVLLGCPCYQWSHVVFGLFVDSLMLLFLLMKTFFPNCFKKKKGCLKVLIIGSEKGN